MEAGKYGRCKVKPAYAFAGEKGCWEITYIVGSMGIKEGGGLRIVPPHRGNVLWKIGKVVAFCSRKNIYLDVIPEKVYPLTYHHSNYPAINIIVYGSDLKKNDRIEVKIGIIGGYNSGRFIQTQAQTHSGITEFEVYVDPIGNANFSRERIRLSAYHKVNGSLKVVVYPTREHHIRFSVRNRPKKEADEIGVISVEDRYENPIINKEYEISLFSENGKVEIPSSIVKHENRSGVKFKVKSINKKTCWIGASCWKKGIYGVSNPVAPHFYEGKYRVYFGDMHVMAEESFWCLGNPEEAILYARDVFGLDFTAITNQANLKSWPYHQKIFQKYNKDYEFVTLPGYEVGFSTGHKNVYYLDESLPIFNPKEPVEKLWEFLSDKEALVISHHPNIHSETDPYESWGPLKISTINPRYERLIEICQNRGSFEKDEVGQEVSFGGFGSSIRDILNKGYRLGFVGGTDTHRGRPGSPLSNQSGLDAESHITGGITGVLAEELTRKSIWEALWKRRCYATTSVRILLDFKLNGFVMGEEINITRARKRFEERRIEVKTAGTAEIFKVVIVRNGEEIYEEEVNKMETKIRWVDTQPLEEIFNKNIGGVYYYAKVYQHDGNIAWSSPIWILWNS